MTTTTTDITTKRTIERTHAKAQKQLQRIDDKMRKIERARIINTVHIQFKALREVFNSVGINEEINGVKAVYSSEKHRIISGFLNKDADGNNTADLALSFSKVFSPSTLQQDEKIIIPLKATPSSKSNHSHESNYSHEATMVMLG